MSRSRVGYDPARSTVSWKRNVSQAARLKLPGRRVVGQAEVAPSVMLSPNASMLLTDNFGTLLTVMLTLQVAVCGVLAASFAVQLLVDAPTEKVEPDAGVQVVVTGALPPVTVGAGKLTGTGAPSSEDA